MDLKLIIKTYKFWRAQGNLVEIRHRRWTQKKMKGGKSKMSKFKKIGGRYGFHSGSGKMKNLEVTGNAWVGGMPIGVIQGDVWYVDSNVNVSGNGQTWDTAMSTIQAAVTAASGYDTIFVAEQLIKKAQEH